MALSNKEKQAALRKRRAKLGLKRIEFYLSKSEAVKMKVFLADLRKDRE